MPKRSGKTVSEVFVSYSRDDAWLVAPFVEVLRLIDPAVFLDQDSIRPGKPWRVEITQAIDRCRLLVVFWCAHAAESPEVKQEYRRAIQLKKDVAPVVLDETPLPRALSKYQAISLCEAFGAVHSAATAFSHDEGAPLIIGRWRHLRECSADNLDHPLPVCFDVFDTDDLSLSPQLAALLTLIRTLLPRLAPTESAVPPKRRPLRKRIKD